MQITTINKKEAMYLKEGGCGIWEGLGKGKGREYFCNYIITSKQKKTKKESYTLTNVERKKITKFQNK